MTKRPAKPGEGEIPTGFSEVPGGGPKAYTDPGTGERVIDVEELPIEAPAPVKAPTSKRSRAAKG